jgi:hypothetical protein
MRHKALAEVEGVSGSGAVGTSRSLAIHIHVSQLGVPPEQSNRERHSLSATNDRVCKLLRCASPPMTAAQGAREQRRGLVSLRHAPLGGVPGRLIPRRLYREPPPNHDRTSGRDALSR